MVTKGVVSQKSSKLLTKEAIPFSLPWGGRRRLNCPKCDEHGFSSSWREHPGRARSAGLSARTHFRQAQFVTAITDLR